MSSPSVCLSVGRSLCRFAYFLTTLNASVICYPSEEAYIIAMAYQCQLWYTRSDSKHAKIYNRPQPHTLGGLELCKQSLVETRVIHRFSNLVIKFAPIRSRSASPSPSFRSQCSVRVRFVFRVACGPFDFLRRQMWNAGMSRANSRPSVLYSSFLYETVSRTSKHSLLYVALRCLDRCCHRSCRIRASVQR